MGCRKGVKHFKHKINRRVIAEGIIAKKSLPAIARENGWSVVGVRRVVKADLSGLASLVVRDYGPGKIYAVDSIGELRKEGKSVKDIASIIGSCYTTVHKVLHTHFPGLVKMPWKPTVRDLEIATKRLNGFTYDQIGQEHGVCRERIRQILKRTAPKLTGRIENVHYRKCPCTYCGAPLHETPCMIKTDKGRPVQKGIPALCEHHLTPFLNYRRS